MGDMTVASPTTGIALAAAFDTARPALKCLSCGTRADAGEPYCAHCGAQVALPIAKGRVASIAATRALQFGALVIVANLVLALASVGVLYFLWMWRRFVLAGRRRRRQWNHSAAAQEIHNAAIVAAMAT